MKRVPSRLIVVAVVAASISMLFPGRAWAPRSWLLPNLNVSCQMGESRPEAFTGSFELNQVAVLDGVVMVGGSIAGNCGVAAVDTLFRTTIKVDDADCSEATLVLGDLTLEKDLRINLSEQPVEVLGTSNKMRKALCPLKNAEKLPPKVLEQRLNLLLNV